MILYHGSDKQLKIIYPKKPNDSIKGVYASSNKKIAIAMGLTNSKGTSSFMSHNTILLNFVKGSPRMKYVYVYYLKNTSFKKLRDNEYVSDIAVSPYKVERIPVSSLSHLWRKSNTKELKKFLKNRDGWRAP